MSVGWLVTLGYVSGSSSKLNRREAEKLLYEKANEVADHHIDILAEATICHAPSADEDGFTLLAYARKHFVERDQPDSMLQIRSINNTEDDIIETAVHLMASGGGLSRTMKEHLARAYVRLLMEAMHERGVDIQVSVA